MQLHINVVYGIKTQLCYAMKLFGGRKLLIKHSKAENNHMSN